MGVGNSVPPLVASPSGMSSRRRVIISVQIVLTVLIVLATARWVIGQGSAPAPVPVTGVAPAIQSSSGSPASPGVPQKLGGLGLINVLTSQAAIDDMSKLHGKGVGVVGGWVGHYQSKGTVWVGEIADENGAAQLLEAMVRRIGAGNQYFGNLRRADRDGLALFSVTGQGQNHYFYQKGNKVIWLAMPVNGDDQFLRDALKSIN